MIGLGSILMQIVCLLICLTSGSKIKDLGTRVDTPTRSNANRIVSPAKTSSLKVFRYEPIVLTEEPSIGTLLVDLSSKLGLDLDTSEFKFRFYSPSSIASHYFLIDQLTGQMKTQRTIDREYLCEAKLCGPCSTSNCTLTIEIVASAPGSQSTSSSGSEAIQAKQMFLSFDVLIEDKNEFPPQFPKSEIFLNLSEAAPVNFQIPLEPAIDRDSRQTMITYSLGPVDTMPTDNDDNIQLNSKLRLVTSPYSSQLSLVIVEPFDYELIHEYSFKLMATDNGSPPLTGICLITLRIVDVNDNIPSFDRQEYEYRVDEGVRPDTRLIRVHASDKDDGLNGQVRYSFGEHIKSDYSPTDYFRIDEITGWISARVLLDYEQINTYRFTVKAQDQGANSMPVYAAVVIHLNDLNDNGPLINVTVDEDMFAFGEGQLSISEWTHVGTFLAQIHVSDADSGPNGQFKIDIEQMPDGGCLRHQTQDSAKDVFAIEHLFNNIYSLLLKQPVDREICDRYKIIIKSTDRGTPPLSTTYPFDVVILDENDNRPTFMHTGIYRFRIDESTSKTLNELVRIGKVSAIDDDQVGPNSQLTYELVVVDKVNKTSQSIDGFQINANTGEIYALGNVLDREVHATIEFDVVCKDNGRPVPLESRTTVIVELVDVNDNAPVFTRNSYGFNLSEDLSPYAKFGRVQAWDADEMSSNNSKFKYEIRNESSIHGIVSVDSTTGDLFLVSTLDYERKRSYEFEVYATDYGGLSSKALVRIQVVDVNDNVPQIVWPKTVDLPLVWNMDVLFDSKVDVSQHLFRVNATDLDSNENSRLNFVIDKQHKFLTDSFDATTNVNLFDCDPSTGLVHGLFIKNKQHKMSSNMVHKKRHDTQPSLDHLIGTYLLVIKVTDSSTINQLQTTQNVVIVLKSNASGLDDTIGLLKAFFANTHATTTLADKRLANLKHLYSKQQQPSGIGLSVVDGKRFFSERLFDRTSKLLLILIIFASIMFLFIILSIFAIICYKRQKQQLLKKNNRNNDRDLRSGLMNKADPLNASGILSPLVTTTQIQSTAGSGGNDDERLTLINTNSPSSSLLSSNSTRPCLKEEDEQQSSSSSSCISSNQTVSTTSMCRHTTTTTAATYKDDTDNKDDKANRNLTTTFKTTASPNIQQRPPVVPSSIDKSKYTTLPVSYIRTSDNFGRGDETTFRNPSTRSSHRSSHVMSNTLNCANSGDIFGNTRAIDETIEFKYASSESTDTSLAADDTNNATDCTAVPEYFFKDQKEYKTFLNSKNKTINCKHLVISGKRINRNNECFL